MDRSFKLELGLLQALQGEAGVKRLEALILDALPTGTVGRTLSQATQILEQAKQSMLYGIVSVECSRAVDAVLETVSNLNEGIPPQETAHNSSKLMQEVWRRLPNFVEHVVDGHPTIRGVEALATKFEALAEEPYQI